jgi:hypothetical protein
MNESDPKLVEALRAVAADGPRDAPAWVEERLLCELRKRGRARRRNLRVAVAAGTIAAGIAVLLWIRPAALFPGSPAPSATRFDVPATPKPVTPESVPAPPQAPNLSEEVALNFYRLPGADELPPVESAMIVRVQLPMSSLRLIGLPVSQERADEPIQADVLLAQDGLARGVRFVE